jgi:hypothetical protein
MSIPSETKICDNPSTHLPSVLWGDFVCFRKVSGSRCLIVISTGRKKEHEALNGEIAHETPESHLTDKRQKKLDGMEIWVSSEPGASPF